MTVQSGSGSSRLTGTRPLHARRAAWQQQVRTIAAYQDGYNITGPDPLRPAATSQGQRLDHQRAETAARRAQTTANEDVARRHGSAQRCLG